MSKIIEINDLKKSFNEVVAVDNISFSIDEGEIFGLLGPNGAGKSTTINILCGLLKKDKGEIKCFLLDHSKCLAHIKQNIGVVPQEIAIYEDLKAIENVMFFASLYGLKGKELKEKSLKALEFVGLLDKKNNYPKTFSGGMKRRLNIACAISHQPKLIIMDEPTVGIDPQSRNHILESVKTLNKLGSTVVYTTHYMEEVEAICTKIGIIDHGKLIAYGTKKELEQIVADFKSMKINIDIGIELNIDSIKVINGVVDVYTRDSSIVIEYTKESQPITDIFNELNNQGIAVRGINMSDLSLETVFLALTGRNLRD